MLPDELHHLERDADRDEHRADGRDQQPRLPLGHVVVLHAPRHAHQAEHVERHEGDVEADDPEPERRLAQALVQPEAERLGKPVGVAGEQRRTRTPPMMTLWKWATRNRLLCSTKSAGGTASSTPVMPPMTKVTMKPIVHSIGGSKTTRPPYIVNSQLKIFTPVGTAMIIVAMPKNALTLAPAPMVKKWCSQTMKDRMQITIVAATIER